MGDGSPVELMEAELRHDLEVGTQAGLRGKIPALTEEELRYLTEVFTSPFRFVSVESGKEIVLSKLGDIFELKRSGVKP